MADQDNEDSAFYIGLVNKDYQWRPACSSLFLAQAGSEYNLAWHRSYENFEGTQNKIIKVFNITADNA